MWLCQLTFFVVSFGHDNDSSFVRFYYNSSKVSGKIFDEQFEKLSCSYEDEQKDLQEKIAVLQAELTPTILNEFVEKIIVHAPDKNIRKRV